MADQIIEISSPGVYLSKNRGVVEVSKDTVLIGKVAIDELSRLLRQWACKI